MNEFHLFLRTRRSIRHFKPDQVPAPVIQKILETATFAPSAHNLQPWFFVMVIEPSAKKRLGQALTSKLRTNMNAEGATIADIEARVARSIIRIDQAPVIILICRDIGAIRKEEPEEVVMATQSVALVGLQILLAAHAEGLGGNWICWPLYAQEETRIALNLPKSMEPQGMIFLGYSNEKPGDKTIKPLGQIVITR